MRRRAVAALVGGSAAAAVMSAWSQAPATPAAPAPRPPVGELKALGNDRFQVGRIVVDKRARRFTLPGRVLSLGKPLEYLATTPGGGKGYETLLEVDATGSEFNLACILLGLERSSRHAKAREVAPPQPLPGPRVSIFVAWQEGSTRREVTAAQAVLGPDAETRPESVEWVYIGSPGPDLHGGFAADTTGTLVGFKPDDNNVIESALGIGIGAYGTVVGNPMLPPNGSPIELIVDAAQAAR
jgi:hypothetical protein